MSSSHPTWPQALRTGRGLPRYRRCTVNVVSAAIGDAGVTVTLCTAFDTFFARVPSTSARSTLRPCRSMTIRSRGSWARAVIVAVPSRRFVATR
ncbi:hypothetical protein [Sphingomonas sp. LR61]|uniref:hypothetical protein n=1 Tax=Sphingomonas sp. LR61 TaxID=3050234 RepID=UPI003FA7E5EE